RRRRGARPPARHAQDARPPALHRRGRRRPPRRARRAGGGRVRPRARARHPPRLRARDEALGGARGAAPPRAGPRPRSLEAPHLREIVDLSIEQAEALGYERRRYDALLDEYEPEATWAEVDAAFRDLRAELVPIVQALAEADPPDDAFLHRPYDPERQWNLGLDVLRAFGYDFARGRQDRSAHPFSTAFSVDDVRVTTRIAPDFFPTGFFGTLHEGGHALYEQGIDPALDRTPLASGTSLGMHESQSR